jgi:hypothetical protein
MQEVEGLYELAQNRQGHVDCQVAPPSVDYTLGIYQSIGRVGLSTTRVSHLILAQVLENLGHILGRTEHLQLLRAFSIKASS